MLRRRAYLPLFVALVVVLAVPALLSAKGVTTKIVIKGSSLASPVEISDPAVLENFVVWAGPGTRMSGVEGRAGFIVDWASGPVREAPSEVQRFEVAFYVKYANRPFASQQDQLAYVVFYEFGDTPSGFVYLPGRGDDWYVLNTRSIYRGREGRWFRANSEWQHTVRPLIERALRP
jgi:hypothetical protein